MYTVSLYLCSVKVGDAQDVCKMSGGGIAAYKGSVKRDYIRMQIRGISVVGLLLALLLCPVWVSAQGRGQVVGKVLDEHGEPLIGATVVEKVHFSGVATDMNGGFTLNLPAGVHTLEFAYMGYVTQQVADVNVKEGQVTPLSVTLAPARTEMEEVVVTATYQKSSAAGALSMQQHMPQVSAVMAAEQIGRTPDKNLGEALRRVTGVSTVGNRFVSVRGMGERWNEASLDGVVLPSTEANAKAFSFDLIPTDLIDNVTVIKTPTPDVTANFSGALIQVSTRDIPAKNFLTLSAGLSFNTISTFREQNSRRRTAADWFAIDDGHRDLPKGLQEIRWNETGQGEDFFEQSKRFTNDNFSLYRSTTAPSQNYQLSIGRSYRLGKKAKDTVEGLIPVGQGDRLGFIASVSYRNTQQQKRIVHTQRGQWYDIYRPTNDDLIVDPQRNQGAVYGFGTTLGGLLNVGWEHGNNRLSLRNMYTRKYDNDLTAVEGWNRDADLQKDEPKRRQTNYPTFQDLLQNKLEGRHRVGIVDLSWNLAHTYVGRNQKDAAFTEHYPYVRDGQVFYFQGVNPHDNKSFPLSRGRYFNRERDYTLSVDAVVPFRFDWFDSKFKTGYAGSYRENRFEFAEAGYYTYKANTKGLPRDLSMDEMLSPDWMRSDGYGWLVNLGEGGNRYRGVVMQHAMYGMFDHRFTDYVRLVWGVRAEYYFYREYENPGLGIEELATVAGREDKPWSLMPSANITLTPFQHFNIRLSYARSVVRPQFMELSGYRFYDPYLGGVTVNQSVHSTNVDGADLRVEWFPAPGEVLSVGGFFRYLKDPIERVKQDNLAGDPYYVLMNSVWAKNWGGEVELRKGLGFIYQPVFENIYFTANATFTWSTVMGVKAEEVKGVYQWVPVKMLRPMYGQVPYMVNVGLSYESSSLGVNVAFNHQGRKLVVVSGSAVNDEYEAPFSSLDAQVSYRFEKQGLTLKLNASNLLNSPTIIYHNSPNEFERGERNAPTNTYLKGSSPNYGAKKDILLYKSYSGIGLSLSVSWTL